MPNFKTNTEEKTEDRTLQDVTTELGETYDIWKDSEKLKDEYKEEFFGLVTDEVRSSVAKKTVKLAAKDAAEAEFLAARQNPRWIVEQVKGTKTKGFSVLLVENPLYVEFVYNNEELEKTFKRQVQDGSTVLDDEMLRKENPDLWLEVSEIPNLDTIEALFDEAFAHWNIEESLRSYIQNQFPVSQRTLKPFSEMTPEQISALDRYIYQSKPVVKFPKPAKIKEESGE